MRKLLNSVVRRRSDDELLFTRGYALQELIVTLNPPILCLASAIDRRMYLNRDMPQERGEVGLRGACPS